MTPEVLADHIKQVYLKIDPQLFADSLTFRLEIDQSIFKKMQDDKYVAHLTESIKRLGLKDHYGNNLNPVIIFKVKF